MKSLCIMLLGILFLLLVCVPASAYTLTSDIIVFDSFLASTTDNLNVNQDVVFAEANDGKDIDLYAYKDESFSSTGWEAVYNVTEGLGSILGYAYDTSSNGLSWPTIESFIVKQGTWSPKTYLFSNDDNKRYLAVAIADSGNMTWDGDVSHVTGLSTNTPVPEPATMLLFGLGLLGLAGVGRRKQ